VIRSWPRPFVAAVALLAVLLSSSVPHALARGPARSTTPVDVGVLINGDPSGDPDTQVALGLAVEDVNAFFTHRQWPLGVRLTVERTGLDPDVALEKIRLLAARGLKVIVGPESSGELQAIEPFVEANQIVVLSHCSTAPSLATPGDSVFRMVPSDARQAATIARLIQGDGKRALVMLHRGDVWGDGISAALRQRFVELGGTVAPGVRFDPDAPQFASDLAALAAQVEQARGTFGDAVAVAFLGFGADGAAALARAGELPALVAVRWYGSDGTAISREILAEPRAARFAVQTGFANTLFADVHTQRADAVRARISAGVGGGSVYFCAMAAYDAVWLAALTATVASPRDTASFERALVEVASVYEGVTGPTTFDAAGDRADAAYDVWAIEEQHGELVWATVPAAILRGDGAR
jgi:branched-chain amino acid transport system substrate-binding protein